MLLKRPTSHASAVAQAPWSLELVVVGVVIVVVTGRVVVLKGILGVGIGVAVQPKGLHTPLGRSN